MNPVGTITEHGETRPLFAGKSWIVEVAAREERATREDAERLSDAIRGVLEPYMRDELTVEVKPVSTIYDPEADAVALKRSPRGLTT